MAKLSKVTWANRVWPRFAHVSPCDLWLGFAFLILYAATTARDILPADSGEFQLTAAKWGIAHPPGYPLYTVAAALWMRLFPLGTAPFRVNLFSAVLAALTLVLIARAVRTWATSWGYRRRAAELGGLAAALLFGGAATFWAQATVANIRMPTMLFAAWGFLALARYRKTQTETGQAKLAPLLELALALGLGIGHHPSLIFIAVGWALYLLLNDARRLIHPRHLWKAALVAATAWVIPQLYLPVRDRMPNVPLAPGDLATWSGFWNHVLARGFGGDMFAFATRSDLALRLPLLPNLFKLQFPPLLLLGIALSWLWLLRRDGKMALAFFVSWLLHTFVTITYRAPQTIEYLMPAYVPMVLVFGLGISGMANGERQSSHPRRYFSLLAPYLLRLICFVLLLRFPLLVPDFAVLAADTSIRARSLPLLEAAPANALILADWHWATPLWVLQQVERRNPQAEVAYVYPIAGQAYEEVWRARAVGAGERPLFSTHGYTWEDWTSTPVGGGFRFYRRPLTTLPEGLDFTALEADLGPIQVLGYRLVGEVKPGRQVELRLVWQADGPQDPAPSFTARLWDQKGTLLAQADRSLGSDTAMGEVRFTHIVLQMPVDRCDDPIHPTLGVYTVQDNGFRDWGSLSLPPLKVTCDFPALPPGRFWPGLIVNGGPWLRGIDYDIHNDRATVYMHWCGPGQALLIQVGGEQAFVHSLRAGRCQTVRLTVSADAAPLPTFRRSDGSGARWLGLPLPAPAPDERYIPFGDEMVLVGDTVTQRDGAAVLNLRWRTARPIVDDYAVSVRLLGPGDTWLGMHDIQPALGTLPTLKWIVRDGMLLDPHPYTLTEQPTTITLAVYERFRLIQLSTPQGEVARFPFPSGK